MQIVFVILLFMSGCQRAGQIEVSIGECVIGDESAIWKLVQKNNNQYLFARMPLQEGSPMEVISDLRTFKKVECPY